MAEGAEPLPSDVLNVENGQDSSGPTIIAVDEFDMAGTERFWAHVSQPVEARRESLTVDARGLTFIDSSGLAAMVRAREAATEARSAAEVAGFAFRIRHPSAAVRRLIDRTRTNAVRLHE